jgi:hypothetical protein
MNIYSVLYCASERGKEGHTGKSNATIEAKLSALHRKLLFSAFAGKLWEKKGRNICSRDGGGGGEGQGMWRETGSTRMFIQAGTGQD